MPVAPYLPVTLTGRGVELRPLSMDHFDALAAISNEDAIWRVFLNSGQSPEQLRQWIQGNLENQDKGTSVPFTTVDRVSGRIAGCTTFMNIDAAHKRVEVGGTWLGLEFQRSHLNTEAKYLMFRHAFEVWGSNRVELKTDALNTQSRNAMLRIGAKEEGTLRRHLVTYSGRVRDTVYFSVIREEWPEVKQHIERLLGKYSSPE